MHLISPVLAAVAESAPSAGSPVLLKLASVDYAILAIYFAFVIGIGWVLKRYLKTSSDYFESGRSLPAWICALGFIGANLGAQEVMGMAASGAKYGISTSHFYWIGAIPAMVFVGIFMMPFYYGSKARSVPEYLKLRFDEKTRTFNALTFAVMTVFSSGISMRRPFVRIACTCSGHWSISTTSSPALVRSAPIEAPLAPAPSTAIFLLLLMRSSPASAPLRRAAL